MTFIGKFDYEIDGNGEVRGAGLSDGQIYLPVASDACWGVHTPPSYAAAFVREVGGDATLDMSARFAVFDVVALPDDIAGLLDDGELRVCRVPPGTEDVPEPLDPWTPCRETCGLARGEECTCCDWDGDDAEEPVRVYDLPRHDPEVPHPAECTQEYEAYSSALRRDIESYPEPRRL